MQAWGGARAVRVEWKGERTERLAEARLVSQEGLVPLLQGCGPSCDIKGTPPPTSSPGLFFMATWILCSPHTHPHLSPTFPQGPLPRHTHSSYADSVYSFSAAQLPAFFIPPFFLEPVLQGSIFCLPLTQTHPSLPVPTCPLLSSSLGERGPRAHSHLSPERPSPLIFHSDVPEPPPQFLDFPNDS